MLSPVTGESFKKSMISSVEAMSISWPVSRRGVTTAAQTPEIGASTDGSLTVELGSLIGISVQEQVRWTFPTL